MTNQHHKLVHHTCLSLHLLCLPDQQTLFLHAISSNKKDKRINDRQRNKEKDFHERVGGKRMESEERGGTVQEVGERNVGQYTKRGVGRD